MTTPNTVEIEARQDRAEDLIELLRDPVSFNAVDPPMTLDQRKDFANKVERNLPNNPDAVAFAGLPGAGKSYASDKLGTVYDAPVISMGDAIRADFRERKGRKAESQELGEWAADWRDDAPEEIPEKVVEMAGKTGEELVIIDGVRSVTDYEVLSDYFENFHLIEIKTPFYERLDRLHERGREGEDGFTAIDLAERDDREMYELGLYFTREKDYIDLEIVTGKRHPKLPITLSKIVENNLPHRIENGEPLGSTGKVEEMRKRQQQASM